jgi:hypothetical protein
VAGLLFSWAVAWLVVPPLLKSQALKAASAQLGRDVSIGAVDFKPWTLELTVQDVAVAGRDGGPPQLAIRRIYMDAELQSLLRLAPVIDAIAVEGPVARLTHLGGGRYDIDDVLHKLLAPAATSEGEPARFAVYNVSISGGAFDFTDQSVGRTQQVRDLQLSVPFLSNIGSQREVKVEPRLAFNLNGSHFDSAAAATPFAQSRKTDASLKFRDFDLRPWLGYLPAAFPVKPRTALLDADLQVDFEQSPRLAVKISGSIGARGVQIADARGQDLLSFDQLRVGLDDVRPLERQVRLSSVELNQPRLELVRAADGQLNVAALAGRPADRFETAAAPASPQASMAASAGGAVAAAAPGPGASGSRGTPATAAGSSGWLLTLASLAVRGGKAHWLDATTSPRAELLLRDVSADASGLTWPATQPALFSGAATLDGKQPAELRFSGAATDVTGSASVTLSAVPVAAGAPYLAALMEPTLSGGLTADAGLSWKVGTGAAQLVVDLRQLALDKLALNQGRTVLASVQKIELSGGRIDLAARSAEIGKLQVVQPRATVERGEDGRWMFERWMKAGAPVSGSSPARGPMKAGASASKASEADGWKLALADASLTGGTVGFRDQLRGKRVSLDLSAVNVQARNFSPQGARPQPLNVSARVGAGQAEAGRVDFRGSVGLQPLLAQGQVEAVDFPLHALEPYFGDALNVELLRAEAGFKGRVRVAQAREGTALRLSGDAVLEEFRANSVPVTSTASTGVQAAEELLAWRALSLKGLDVSVAPGTATQVEVRETALSDFFARIVINETGRINLQDIVKASVPAGTTSTLAATATVASAAVSTATGSATPPVIRFGPVSLLNGKVRFADRFVKPNYSADLSELNGKLSAFASTTNAGSPQLADLELRGRAEGTASLEVLGKINPLAKPLALDIKGKVRDLELPPLSPYSVKYAGHGIERGKLSVDVAYLVRPDGQLTASNRLVLNQLSFGEPVPNAPASLPVKLAVALLADRNGMIDIDLPISGSLNDPQFSLGPVIFKIIINIIGKALTAPFSLLASAFGGGGDELSMVSFSPGSAVLEPEAQKGLDRVAKALADRPALKMTVVGTASLEVEREAWKRERLNQLVRAEKRREAVVAGSTATAAISVSAAEYPALLKEVYRRADIKKPRNMIGMAKDIPQAEMEELLLANISATEEAMRELAVRRGVAVRDYLASKQLPAERLFLGAAKAVAPEAKYSPRAELNLAAP